MLRRTLLLAPLLRRDRGRRAGRAAAPRTPRTSLNDVEDEVMCVVCGVPLNIAESPAGRPRARATSEPLIAAGPDEAADQGRRCVAEYGARHARRPAEARLRRRRLARPVGVVLGALVALVAACCRAGAGAASGRGPATSGAAARPRAHAPTTPRASTRTSRRYDADCMLAARRAQADTTVLAAFAVGFVSFISPCVLPLVPGYLSAVSGVSIAELRARSTRRRAVLRPGDHLLPVVHRRSSSRSGMTATGHRLDAQRPPRRSTRSRACSSSRWACSSSLTPFVAAPEPRVAPRGADRAAPAPAARSIAGAAFAIAWTPCVGPTLGAILAAAADARHRRPGRRAARLLLAGLAVPFLLTARRLQPRDDRLPLAARPLPRRHRDLRRVLIVMGVLILTRRADPAQHRGPDACSNDVGPRRPLPRSSRRPSGGVPTSPPAR